MRTGILFRIVASAVVVFVIGTAGTRSWARQADSLFAAGLVAYQQGDFGEAVSRLQQVVALQPGIFDVRYGSAQYWLGSALDRLGRAQEAQAAWRRGMRRLMAAGLVDARLADAFVRATFDTKDTDDYGAAADAYLRLIEFLNGPILPDLLPLLREHMRDLLPILPKDLIATTGLAAFVENEAVGAVASGTGTRLATWWRGNDLAPATRKNERLEEHLERVAYARANYYGRDDFDDRGRLFIRFGPPSRQASIDLGTALSPGDEIDRSLGWRVSSFPKNEIWTYDQVDKDAVFLFYGQGRNWRLGEVRDLLPPNLLAAVSGSPRGAELSIGVVRLLELLYEQLSMVHVAYATRYQEVLTASTQSVPGGGGRPSSRPDLVARRALADGHVGDLQLFAERDERLPTDHTNTFDGMERATMPVRLARFLDPDGTTRTEIYWGIPPGAVTPSRRQLRRFDREGIAWQDAMLLQTVVHRDHRNEPRLYDHRRMVLAGIARDRSASVAPQTYVARGDSGLFGLAGQWDLYPVVDRAGDDVKIVDQPYRTYLARFDSLDVLSNDPAHLEMSDLKPILLSEEVTLAPEVAADAQGHPFPVLSEDRYLVLYFEIYHLEPDASGESQFEVAYEVAAPGGAEPATGSRTMYRASGPTAREAVFLDLADWRRAGSIEVTVRVYEPTSGRSVFRSIRLESQD